MKNTLLALSFAFTAALSAQAQDSSGTTASDFKPVAGDKTIEVGTSLYFGNNNYYYNNSGATLQFRKFTSDTHAFRIGASAHFDHNDYGNGIKSNFSVLTFALGTERHFAGTSRISPYIGAELPLSIASSSYENKESTIKGAWSNGGQNRAFKAIGLNAVAGVDFYIVKNFYIGLEFGAGVAYRKYSDIKIDGKGDNFTNQTIEGGKSISLSTFSNSGIRIGFVF